MFSIFLSNFTFVSNIEDYIYTVDQFQWWMKSITIPLRLQLNFKDETETFYQAEA